MKILKAFILSVTVLGFVNSTVAAADKKTTFFYTCYQSFQGKSFSLARLSNGMGWLCIYEENIYYGLAEPTRTVNGPWEPEI